MLGSTLRVAVVVVIASLLATRSSDAQVTGRSGPQRRAGKGSSSPSQLDEWWNGQVRSFQHRWRLADTPGKAARAPKKVIRRRKPAGPAKNRNVVRPVSFQMPAATARPIAVRPAAIPYAIPHVVAPATSKPADPATAGLMPGYPQFNGSLYPSPRADIPYQVGGTAITNQALAPHEMLYPHRYRALYPPYYYKVRGHWMVTPFGVWSRDRWQVEGTEVEVNYKPRISFLSLFTPPVLR